MRRILLTVMTFLLLCPAMRAQDAAIVESADSIPSIIDAINLSSSKITVSVPEPVANLLWQHGPAVSDRASAASGYRIEMYADNNPRTARNNATARKNAVVQAFPELRTYLTFESPYWRLRVGDYPTYAEADAALRDLRTAFPNQASEMRIVRSRIIVSE